MPAPGTVPVPAIGAEAPIPIVPVIRGGEDVGIKSVVVDIPVPHRPQSAAIDDIPIERAADGDGVARVAEADDAHGHLVILGIAVEAIHPTVVLLVDDERIHAVIERVAVGGADAQGHVADLGLLHVVALFVDIAAHVAATVIRIVVNRQRAINLDRSRLAIVADAHSRHGHLLCCRRSSRGCGRSRGSRRLRGSHLLLRDEVEVIIRLCGHRAQHDRHQKTKE